MISFPAEAIWPFYLSGFKVDQLAVEWYQGNGGLGQRYRFRPNSVFVLESFKQVWMEVVSGLKSRCGLDIWQWRVMASCL